VSIERHRASGECLGRCSDEESFDSSADGRAADGTVTQGLRAVATAGDVATRQEHCVDGSIHTHAATVQLLQQSILSQQVFFFCAHTSYRAALHRVCVSPSPTVEPFEVSAIDTEHDRSVQ